MSVTKEHCSFLHLKKYTLEAIKIETFLSWNLNYYFEHSYSISKYFNTLVFFFFKKKGNIGSADCRIFEGFLEHSFWRFIFVETILK